MTGTYSADVVDTRTGAVRAIPGTLPSARAGLWRTVTDDGFALAIVLGSVALAWAAAGILAGIILLVERIAA